MFESPKQVFLDQSSADAAEPVVDLAPYFDGKFAFEHDFSENCPATRFEHACDFAHHRFFIRRQVTSFAAAAFTGWAAIPCK